MLTPSTRFATVEAYFSALPAPTKKLLRQLRETIRAAAPGAQEVISYNMPAIKLKGVLVWYAGYKQHIGFYPRPSTLQAFKKELSGYKGSKGAVQFPLDEPLPLDLITRMVKFRVKEDQLKQ